MRFLAWLLNDGDDDDLGNGGNGGRTREREKAAAADDDLGSVEEIRHEVSSPREDKREREEDRGGRMDGRGVVVWGGGEDARAACSGTRTLTFPPAYSWARLSFQLTMHRFSRQFLQFLFARETQLLGVSVRVEIPF